MTSRPRTALATTLAATAVAFVAGLTVAPPASANVLCYGAGVSGTITGTHDEGPFCNFDTPLPVVCTTPKTGLTPTIDVWAEACA
jgi:hypothetical protein